MPYRPVSTNDRFIPAQIQKQTQRLDELETLTGGQVQGRLAAIRRRAQIDSGSTENTGWTESQNNWVTTATLTFTVPDARTTAHVLARTNGTLWLEGNWNGTIETVINTTHRPGALTRPFLGIQADFIAIGSALLDVTPGDAITIASRVRITGTFVHIPDFDGTPMPNTATLDALIAYT